MSEQQKNDGNLNEDTVLEASASSEVESVVAEVVPPGEQLAAIRKSKGLSIEQVASHLKLAQRQVNAIEADNYAALPGMAITRGFIRAYAKYLNVDAATLLDALPKQEMRLGSVAGSERVQSATYQESTLPLRDRNNASKLVAVAVMAIVVALAVFYYFNIGSSQFLLLPETSSEEVAQAVEENPAAKTVGASDALPVGDAKQPDLASVPAAQTQFERIPVAGAASVNVPAPAASNVVNNTTTTTAPVAAQQASVAPVALVAPQLVVEKAKSMITSPNSRDALRMVMREDSWVELRRLDGTVVYSKLIPAGTTDSIDVTEPLQLVIGNASGVQATLRGAPLDLPLSKNNVARLNLK